MSEYKLKPPKQAEVVADACCKMEDAVEGLYKRGEAAAAADAQKRMEDAAAAGTHKRVGDAAAGAYERVKNTIIGSCRAIEKRLVDTFLEMVDDDDRGGGTPVCEEEYR